MSIKRLLLLVLFFFFISFFIPRTSKAVDFQGVLTSEDSIVVKIQEGIEYFFAFKIEKKVEVLEKHAEKRLVRAEGYAEEGNNEKVQNLLQNYLQIKEKQNNLLGETDDGNVLGAVTQRTIEQQKTIEVIKTKIDVEVKQQVIQVQEKVVNQVAQRVIDVDGSDGATEFFQKVENVWAPGTGPGGESGVVIKGGTMQFAPGTSAGGESGADIQNVVVESGGGPGNSGTSVVEGGNQNAAPNNSSGGEGKTVVEE